MDEEFPDRDPRIDKLTSIGRMPVGAGDLDIPMDLIDPRRTVVLLGVYDGSGEHVERYRVPELFRYRLRLTRWRQV